MATLGCRVRFTARHGTREVLESAFTVEAKFVGAVQDGLVAGLDDRVLFARLNELAGAFESQHLDDLVGRATLENIARYVFHRLSDMPVGYVRVAIQAGWAEVTANDIGWDYTGTLAFERAVSLLLRDRTEEALRAFDDAVAIHPTARVQNARGRCLRKLGRLSDAIEAYGRAIAEDPRCGEAYRNRGNALLESGRQDDMLADFDKAVLLLPATALAFNNRGFALATLEEHERALSDHTRAIELDARYEEAFRDRAQALTALERPEEAMLDLARADELAGTLDGLALRRNKLLLSEPVDSP